MTTIHPAGSPIVLQHAYYHMAYRIDQGETHNVDNIPARCVEDHIREFRYLSDYGPTTFAYDEAKDLLYMTFTHLPSGQVTQVDFMPNYYR